MQTVFCTSILSLLQPWLFAVQYRVRVLHSLSASPISLIKDPCTGSPSFLTPPSPSALGKEVQLKLRSSKKKKYGSICLQQISSHLLGKKKKKTVWSQLIIYSALVIPGERQYILHVQAHRTGWVLPETGSVSVQLQRQSR